MNEELIKELEGYLYRLDTKFDKTSIRSIALNILSLIKGQGYVIEKKDTALTKDKVKEIMSLVKYYGIFRVEVVGHDCLGQLKEREVSKIKAVEMLMEIEKKLSE